MKYDEMLELLEKNKHYNQVFSMHIGDSVQLGITKPPADFQRGIIGRMRDNIPGNNMKDRKFQIPREW